MAPDAQLDVAYRLLSASLYQPSEEWREEDIFLHLGEALKAVSPGIADRADVMKESSLDGMEKNLPVEYARLFVGPFALQAPPYGSIYLEPGSRVMGETTLAVQRCYREAGLTLGEDFGIVPDHMAVELEFMSFLLQKAIQAGADGDAEGYAAWVGKRRSFLEAYLSGWCGDFCERVRKGTESRFYRALADCLEGVVKTDMEMLSVVERKA